MRLPKPIAGFRQNHGYGGSWEQVSHEYMHEADVTRMFTEAQLIAEIERRDAALRVALEALQGADEIDVDMADAIRSIQEVLG